MLDFVLLEMTSVSDLSLASGTQSDTIIGAVEKSTNLKYERLSIGTYSICPKFTVFSYIVKPPHVLPSPVFQKIRAVYEYSAS